MNDAADLVDLYHIIHTDAESVKHVKPEHGPLDRVQVTLIHILDNTRNWHTYNSSVCKTDTDHMGKK